MRNHSPNADARFWAKVDVTDGCWLWTASKMTNGYGQFVPRKPHITGAHRYSYELAFGAIPEGLVLDHLCRVRHCVNPAHLEPVSQRVNILRGAGHGSETECPAGHPYDARNTHFELSRGRVARKCRACGAARARAKRQKERAA